MLGVSGSSPKAPLSQAARNSSPDMPSSRRAAWSKISHISSGVIQMFSRSGFGAFLRLVTMAAPHDKPGCQGGSPISVYVLAARRRLAVERGAPEVAVQHRDEVETDLLWTHGFALAVVGA